MKKSHFWGILSIALMVIGFIVVIINAHGIDNYPGMREMRKAAFDSVQPYYWVGLTILIAGWLLSIFAKRLK